MYKMIVNEDLISLMVDLYMKQSRGCGWVIEQNKQKGAPNDYNIMLLLM